MTDKVLLVDDEPNILSGFKRHLRKRYDLHVAVGGEAALKMISTDGPFAVVVSDMQMPEMSGVELLAKLQDRRSNGAGDADRECGPKNSGRRGQRRAYLSVLK